MCNGFHKFKVNTKITTKNYEISLFTLYAPKRKILLFLKGVASQFFYFYFSINHLAKFEECFLPNVTTLKAMKSYDFPVFFYHFKSSLPLPPISQTVRCYPGNYCRELTTKLRPIKKNRMQYL